MRDAFPGADRAGVIAADDDRQIAFAHDALDALGEAHAHAVDAFTRVGAVAL